MNDVPTLTSATTANYCVLNPLDKNTSITASNGNLTATTPSGFALIRSTMFLPTGKYYWEVTCTTTGNGFVGISSAGESLSSRGAETANSATISTSNGNLRTSGADSAYGSAISNGDVMIFALDMTSGKFWAGKNGTWFASGDPAAGTNAGKTGLTVAVAPSISLYDSENYSANFGQRPFSYTPPTGFLPLNTYNLPTPTILDGDQYFNATTYTGTGATLAVTNSGSMQPDFVWIKTRNQAGYGHELFDSVRGATKFLISNSTGAESTEATSLTAFNSNGFTVGSWGFINGSGDSEIAWQWRASNAAGVSNTNGTITSTVSVNTTAGFSILTYTGNGSSTATVGHGLGVEPAMLIQYERAGGDWWHIWHTGLSGSSYNVFLNNTEAERASVNDGQIKNNGSSTFAFASTTSNVDAVNENGKSYVVYCFSQVAGYSAFGKYTGNGSDDGPFIYTGFRPRFIFRKCISTSGENSMQYDTSMNPYNAAPEWLSPNTSDASNTAGGYYIDFVSNGVKIRHSATGNNSGRTYIYMAFAENPFKISRAR
jgi:hypothetical protein